MHRPMGRSSKARRFIALVAIVGLASIVNLAVLAAPAPATAASSSQPQADLAWFLVGLRDLGKSRDTRLKLLPAQAKKILPVLEQLVSDKILVTEIPEGQDRPNGQSFGGRQGGGAPTEKQRQEMQARQRKTAERIQQAIDKMDGMLRQAQSDYIMSLDFDPAVYGLDRARVFQGQDQRPSQAELQKMLKTRQEARQRLVQLNQEVLAMVKKLATGK